MNPFAFAVLAMLSLMTRPFFWIMLVLGTLVLMLSGCGDEQEEQARKKAQREEFRARIQLEDFRYSLDNASFRTQAEWAEVLMLKDIRDELRRLNDNLEMTNGTAN